MDGNTKANPLKLIERFSENTRKTVAEVLAHDSLSKDWPGAWVSVAEGRIALAGAHLAGAVMVQQASEDAPDPEVQRAVFSRAYYAMFCAARATLSLETGGDVNDHQKLPSILKGTTGLGPTEDRDVVVSAISKFRRLRNDADDSPYYTTSIVDDACAAVVGWKRSGRREDSHDRYIDRLARRSACSVGTS